MAGCLWHSRVKSTSIRTKSGFARNRWRKPFSEPRKTRKGTEMGQLLYEEETYVARGAVIDVDREMSSGLMPRSDAAFSESRSRPCPSVCSVVQ